MMWADSKHRKCCEAEGSEKHRLHHCREWREERNKIPGGARTCDMKARSSKEDWECQRVADIVSKCGGNWAGSKSWKQQWVSHTSRSWDRRVEGFRNYIAVDGS